MMTISTSNNSYPFSFERSAQKLQARKNKFFHDVLKDRRKENLPLDYHPDHMMLIFSAVVLEVATQLGEMFSKDRLYVIDNLLIKSLMDENFRQKLQDGYFDNDKTTPKSSSEQ